MVKSVIHISKLLCSACHLSHGSGYVQTGLAGTASYDKPTVVPAPPGSQQQQQQQQYGFVNNISGSRKG